MNITCLRFFTVYGPFGRPDMAFFLILLTQLKKIKKYIYLIMVIILEIIHI